MEKLNTIQEARLKCLQMANDYAQNATTVGSNYELSFKIEDIIPLAEEYVAYVLEGTKTQPQTS